VIGPEHGLAEACVISCDNVITIPIVHLDDQPVGRLDELTRARLDEALRYSLDIVYRPRWPHQLSAEWLQDDSSLRLVQGVDEGFDGRARIGAGWEPDAIDVGDHGELDVPMLAVRGETQRVVGEGDDDGKCIAHSEEPLHGTALSQICETLHTLVETHNPNPAYIVDRPRTSSTPTALLPT